MSMGVNWLKEIVLVDRPKPKPILLKDTLLALLRQTVKEPGKVVQIPKAKYSSTQGAYTWAREAGFVHHTEANGNVVYLWWTPRPQPRKRKSNKGE